MMAKCPHCKRIVRINEHKVFLLHSIVNNEYNTAICKGSFTKAVFIEP